MPRLLVLLPTLMALLLGPGEGAEAQTLRGQGAESALERGDELHARMQPREALAAYRAALAEDPHDLDALLRAARECSVLGRLASDEEAAARWFEDGEALARRAVANDPGSIEGRYRLAAILDEQATDAGARLRIELADEIRGQVDFVLERDSAHAGAHHVLGRWHAEIERLGGVARFFARHVLGQEVLDEASWERAIHHLERAVETAPETLTFQLTLAETYLDRGRAGDARGQLRQILERPSLQPVDPQVKQRAQELLKANP